MSASGTKVPAVVAVGVICLVLGIGGGAFLMTVFGHHWGYEFVNKPKDDPTAPGGEANAKGPGGPPPGMMGGPPGGMGGMGRGPSFKTQLATLIGKIDQLTLKPLALQLDDVQRKQIHQQLQGLLEEDEVSDEDARTRLDALLEMLKGQRDTLEAAGYRWPAQKGGGGGPGGPPPGGVGPAAAGVESLPNPFKADRNAERIKSLLNTASKGGKT